MSSRMYRDRVRVTAYLSRAELKVLRDLADVSQVSISRLIRTAVLHQYGIQEVRHRAI